MTRTLRGIFGIVMVGTVALAGCGGVATTDDAAPDGNPTGDVIVGATQAAESARISFTWDWHTESSEDDNASETDPGPTVLEGVIDFAADRGSMKDATPPPPPTTTAPPKSDNSESVSVATSSSVAEYRWIGSMTYSLASDTAPGFAPTRPWTAIDQAQVADASECPHDGRSTSAMFGVGGSATTVLEDLRADGSSLTKAGTERIRDVDTTRWRVRLPDPHPDPRCDSSEKIASEVSEYSVWTDKEGRARRVKTVVTTTFLGDEEFPGDTTSTITMTAEFYDFGVPVDIEAPPADQVTDLTESWAMMMRGPGTVDDKTWTRAASGTSNGEPWTIWFAESSTGWRCYDMENAPDNFGGAVLNAGDSKIPKHDGRTADCRPAGGLLGEAFTVYVTEASGVDRVRLYGHVPGSGTARIHFPDGTEAALRPDPNTHIAIWEGETPKGRTYVVLDDGTRCRLDTGSLDENDSFETSCGYLSSLPVSAP